MAASLVALAAASTSGAAVGPSLSGTVDAGGRPLADATVTLFVTRGGKPRRLGSATTTSRGGFRIAYRQPHGDGVLYAVATGGDRAAGRAIVLMTLAGHADLPLKAVTVNDLTTVASAYSLAQLASGTSFRGPALANAAATVFNLVTPAGRPAQVVAQPPNGSDTRTLATMQTLADIVAGCTRGGVRNCHALFAAARPPRSRAPRDTLRALLDIAQHPTNHVSRLYGLRKGHAYGRGLRVAPSAWVLSLVYAQGGFDGPGRLAFDSHGNLFVTNNFQPPGTDAGLGLVALASTGFPIDSSPITGGGLQGVWWGIAVDAHNHIWTSNFVGSDTTPFYSPDFTGGDTVSEFNDNGTPVSPSGFTNGDLSAPQGIAIDQRGDVFIANHGSDTVTEYPGGNPAAAFTIGGGGVSKPFGIAVDAQGNEWVTDNALSSLPGGVSEITPAGSVVKTLEGGGLSSPQGIATDQFNNKWVADFGSNSVTEAKRDGALSQIKARSFSGPWGIAVDGRGNVWVASFVGETLTELCGAHTAACPPRVRTGQAISPARRGFSNGGLEHLTAVQVDQSGDVWVANNWSKLNPITGGNGVVEFIGLAAPVRTPLIGPPQQP